MKILYSSDPPANEAGGAPPVAAEVVTSGTREKIEKPAELPEGRAASTEFNLVPMTGQEPPIVKKSPQGFGGGLTFFDNEDTSDPKPPPKKPSGRWTFLHEQE